MNKNIYRQADSRWKSLPYPTKAYSFGGNGCGACSVLHCIIEQDKYKAWTPKNIQPYMKQFATCGHGTLWSGIKTALEHYGYNVHWNQADSMSTIFKTIEKSLKRGVILFGSTHGPDGTVWTASGHYIAFTDYKVVNGKHYFYRKDSGGRHHDKWWCYERSMKGDVRQVWICTSLKDSVKAIKKPTGKYDGPIPIPTIKNGKEGNNVKNLQKFLTWYGIKLTVDGKCAEKTVNAIKVFQKTEGLTVDGSYGSKSYQRAKTYKAEKPTPDPTPETPQEPKNADLSAFNKIVDISYWQAVSNFKTAKKDGVDGAIIRTSYTSQSKFSLNADSRFKMHIQNAIDAGIPVGVYHYSQALSEAEARKEAEYMLKIIKPYKQYITLPVVIDYEFGGRLNSTSAKKLGKAGVDKIITAFCQTVIDAGYTAMVYANLTTFRNYMNYDKIRGRFLIWLAQYSSKPSIDNCDLWQYTSKGKVSGLSGNIDISKPLKKN